MSKDIIEIKLRFTGEVGNWDMLPVTWNGEKPRSFSKFLDGFFRVSKGSVRELRWNCVGSQQGHYYQSVAKFTDFD